MSKQKSRDNHNSNHSTGTPLALGGQGFLTLLTKDLIYFLFLVAIIISTNHDYQAFANDPTTTTSTTKPPSTSIQETPSTIGPSQASTTLKQETATTPTVKEREEIKKMINAHTTVTGPNRLTVNKPSSQASSLMQDFEPSSPEARVSSATSQFGLTFINNLPEDQRDNVVISPLSLQNLLNMVLLGTGDNSATAKELIKTLNYDTYGLLNSTELECATDNSRLKPHEAMRSVFQSIISATHINVQTELLNTNPDSANGFVGQLQTSRRDGEIPLDGQLNFTLANLVMTNKELVKLCSDYEKELMSLYDVQLEEFSRNSSVNSTKKDSPARQALHERVNEWVEKKTQGMIKDLAKQDDLSDPNLVMVLLNAAHFKGRWQHTFNSKATHDSAFYNHGSDKEAISTKFMRQKGTFGYADFGTASIENEMMTNKYWQALEAMSKQIEDSDTVLTEDKKEKSSKGSDGSGKSATTTTTSAPTTESLSMEERVFLAKEARRKDLTMKLNCSVLQLPFSLNDGQELSMVILLPAQRDGLKELQAALNAETLNEVYSSLNEQTVQVELPKFTFEASYDAKSILRKMGLSSVFEDSANFDRMFSKPTKPAHVDKVIHKAKILVDESGAEAAAASMATVMLRNSIQRPPAPKFIADHPFLFVIRHNRSNMPLFMGRVNKL